MAGQPAKRESAHLLRPSAVPGIKPCLPKGAFNWGQDRDR